MSTIVNHNVRRSIEPCAQKRNWAEDLDARTPNERSWSPTRDIKAGDTYLRRDSVFTLRSDGTGSWTVWVRTDDSNDEMHIQVELFHGATWMHHLPDVFGDNDAYWFTDVPDGTWRQRSWSFTWRVPGILNDITDLTLKISG